MVPRMYGQLFGFPTANNTSHLWENPESIEINQAAVTMFSSADSPWVEFTHGRVLIGTLSVECFPIEKTSNIQHSTSNAQFTAISGCARSADILAGFPRDGTSGDKNVRAPVVSDQRCQASQRFSSLCTNGVRRVRL